MARIAAGSYRGASDDLNIDLRVRRGLDGRLLGVGGDLTRGDEFLGSFRGGDATQDTEDGTIVCPIVFRGHPELFRGLLRFDADERGLGAFQLTVDLEGGFRDIFAGSLEWQGTFLRKLFIEIDGVQGAEPPDRYASREGQVTTLQAAFEAAGFDVTIRRDPFQSPEASGRVRGWTAAEIHTAMQAERSPVPPDRIGVHVFVCSYFADDANVLGIMYDFGQDDLNDRPREGVAIFYDHPLFSDPRTSKNERDREYLFTVIHEIGHALNLPHSFDRGRPSALSWMNYPNLYPRGYEAKQDWDGTHHFWRNFGERFEDEELEHLSFATPREILPGKYPFLTYDEGHGFLDNARARLTRPGANPLRATRDVALHVEPLKADYHLGEPVFVKVSVGNRSARDVYVPRAFDPSDGYLRVTIKKPGGEVVRYRPPLTYCKQAPLLRIPAGKGKEFDHAGLFLSASGPMFTEPGRYEIRAELAGIDGSRVAYSRTAVLTVRTPDRNTEQFAHQLWAPENASLLRAVYLRHPLNAGSEWRKLQESAWSRPIRENPGDNTTASYLSYIEGMGWSTPFTSHATGRDYPWNAERAIQSFRSITPQHLEHLPDAVLRRVEKCAEEPESFAETISKEFCGAHPLDDSDWIRGTLAPAGLFGSAGFLAPETSPKHRVARAPGRLLPFVDVAAWTLEALDDPENWEVLHQIGQLIRSSRCDLWCLRGAGEAVLGLLLQTINTTGRIRYDARIAPRRDDRVPTCGVLYRADTTALRAIDLTDMTGFDQTFAWDVRIKQADERTFDCSLLLADFRAEPNRSGEAAEALYRCAREVLTLSRSGDLIIVSDVRSAAGVRALDELARDTGLATVSIDVPPADEKASIAFVGKTDRLERVVITCDGEVFDSRGMPDHRLQVVDQPLKHWTTKLSESPPPVAVRFVRA